MRLQDFDYSLPPELIAQEPLEPRDSSRLLILDRAGGGLRHAGFRDIGQFLAPGDLLVLNDTRVLPARIFASKRGTGGREGLPLPLSLPILGRDKNNHE